MICDEEVVKMRETRSRHLCPNPIAFTTWMRNPQFRESNAFAMSNLRKIRDVFLLLAFLITFLTYRKLS
jgi:hypothetical protein